MRRASDRAAIYLRFILKYNHNGVSESNANGPGDIVIDGNVRAVPDSERLLEVRIPFDSVGIDLRQQKYEREDLSDHPEEWRFLYSYQMMEISRKSLESSDNNLDFGL